MSTHAPPFNPADVPRDALIAIVAARFNAHIVDELLAGCTRRLKELGIAENRVLVHRVPGAFELPVAAQWLAEMEKYSAIICLGCVIRGDTPHFDYVAGEACARDSAGGDQQRPAGDFWPADHQHRRTGPGAHRRQSWTRR